MTEPLVFRGPEGSITVTAAALTELVAQRSAAASTASACAGRARAVEVRHAGGSRLGLPRAGRAARAPLPGLARAVQERVGEALAQVTGLEVERVDVEIAEIG